MKREIKLLENNLINKIAAGEVIERPASIVKELVENSIDALSKNITIEIKNGLISLVKWRIEVDNNNILFVKKNIIGGPEKIEKYFEYARNL